MKTLRIMMVVLLAATLSVTANAQKKNHTETVTFKTNFDCGGCVSKVEKNIPFEKGVKDVVASLEKKEVTITFDSKKTSKEKLQKAIEKLDLTAEEKCCDSEHDHSACSDK